MTSLLQHVTDNAKADQQPGAQDTAKTALLTAIADAVPAAERMDDVGSRIAYLKHLAEAYASVVHGKA